MGFASGIPTVANMNLNASRSIFRGYKVIETIVHCALANKEVGFMLLIKLVLLFDVIFAYLHGTRVPGVAHVSCLKSFFRFRQKYSVSRGPPFVT